MKTFNKEVPSKELFVFLKYNQIIESVKLSKEDEIVYDDFCKKIIDLQKSLKTNASNSSILIGSILSIFGFLRHYCSTCGRPIIGRYSKIGNRVTCNDCFESLQIIQTIGKKEKQVEPKKEKQVEFKKDKVDKKKEVKK